MHRKHHSGKAETAFYRTDTPWAVATDSLRASVVSNCSKNVSPKTGHRAQEELITRVSQLLAGRPEQDMQKDSTLAALDYQARAPHGLRSWEAARITQSPTEDLAPAA